MTDNSWQWPWILEQWLSGIPVGSYLQFSHCPNKRARLVGHRIGFLRQSSLDEVPPPKLTFQVSGMVFSPSGHLLATWGTDFTVKVWSTAPLVVGEPERFPLAIFICDAGIHCCCWAGSADDRGDQGANVLSVGDAIGHVHFLQVPSMIPARGQA